jgi:hypothetical protein
MKMLRLAILLCFAVLPRSLAGMPPGGDGKIPAVSGDSLLLFVSDTQEPIFFETLRIPANHNNTAREMIYSRLVADRPCGIFHLGDMISIGDFPSTWRSTDRFLDRASAAHIPVLPTLGNHELLVFPSYGIEQFYDRFPWYRKTGYAVHAGSITVVLLNSNFETLTRDERTAQVAWLDSTLDACEADSSVRAVILCCHHPPYTNSIIVSPSKEVQSVFVPPYLRHAKCRLFLSGHCHALEHFHEGGKDFLVIGGGGGLQSPLLTGEERRWVDHYPGDSGKRMFHYIQCRAGATGIELSVNMIRDDFSGFRDAYEVFVPYKAP